MFLYPMTPLARVQLAAPVDPDAIEQRIASTIRRIRNKNRVKTIPHLGEQRQLCFLRKKRF
jgi:hypothetical protein